MDINISFYIYKETIRDNIKKTPCIPPEVVEAYKAVTHFKAGHNHMYVQEKKDPYQQWIPTQYRLTEEEMGHIMVDWEDEWKIQPKEVRPSEKEKLEVHEVDDEEEEGDTHKKGNDTDETTQKTTLRTNMKRKELEIGRSVPQWTKCKAVKEADIQALMEEYLEKIGDQVKEVTNDAFQRATQQHEEMNIHMQEQMDEF
jgi:hypothetical protein